MSRPSTKPINDDSNRADGSHTFFHKSSARASSNNSGSGTTNRFVDTIHGFRDGHERLKNSVHSYWRQNRILSPRGTAGKIVMGCFYFSIPVAFGYFVVPVIAEGADATAEERFGKHAGNTSADAGTVGAGTGRWWAGGVNLAIGDEGDKEANRIHLERFVKRQRKKRKEERGDAPSDGAARE